MSPLWLRNLMRPRLPLTCYRQTVITTFPHNSTKTKLRCSSTSASYHAPGVAQGWSQRKTLSALALTGAFGALAGTYANRLSSRRLTGFFGIHYDLERLDGLLREIESGRGKPVSKELLDAIKQDVADLKVLYTASLIDKVNRDLGGSATASNSLLRKPAEIAHSTRLADAMKPVVLNGTATMDIHLR